MRTHRFKHYFTHPDFPGEEIGTFGKSATDHDQVRGHLGHRWTEGAVYARTETLPYKYAPIVADVIAHLPGSWDAEPVGHEWADTNFELIREDGLRLFFSGPNYSHKSKFRVSFSHPKHPVDGRIIRDIYDRSEGGWKQFHPESANVAETKTGEQIAKDIVRRVLPSAEIAQRLCLEQIAKDTEARSARDTSLASVCEVIGKPMPGEDRREYRYNLHLDLPGSSYGSIVVNEGGSVLLELRSLPLETAVKVLQALRF